MIQHFSESVSISSEKMLKSKYSEYPIGWFSILPDPVSGSCRICEQGLFMLSYILPMALIVTCNVFYQICSKGMPDINPFALLTVTYLTGALLSIVLFFVMGHGEESLIRQYGRLNWAPFVLGLVITGLEAGWIIAYRAGWQVSTGFITQASILSLFLILVGALLYGEKVTPNKIIGVVICLVGLFVINYK